MEYVCSLGVRFTIGCSWNSRWTRTWHRLGLQLGLDALAGLLMAKEEDVQGLSWCVLHLLGVCSNLSQGSKGEHQAYDDIVAPGRNSDNMSRWFGGLADMILSSNQIHLKTYKISFPSSAHGPHTHSGWRIYGHSNEVLSSRRWSECSTSMKLHFDIGLVHDKSILYHHHHCSYAHLKYQY
jgi:hypothetical protein